MSGGMLVLDIVKHVGAGIASVLPLGVMKLAALIWSLLPENDRTTGIDWLVSAHDDLNVVRKIWVDSSALEGFLGIRAKYVVVLVGEAQQVLSERLQRHRFDESPARVRCTRSRRAQMRPRRALTVGTCIGPMLS